MDVCVNSKCAVVWDVAFKLVLRRRVPGKRAIRGVPAGFMLFCVRYLDPSHASSALLGTSQIYTIKGANRAGRTSTYSLHSVPHSH